MSTAVLLLLVAVLAVPCLAVVISRPVCAVALPLAAAGVAVVHVPGIPFSPVVSELLAAAGVAAVLTHVVVARPRRLSIPRGAPAVGVLLLGTFLACVVVSSAAAVSDAKLIGTSVALALAITYAVCVVAVAGPSSRNVLLLLETFAFGSVAATAPALLQGGGLHSAFGGGVVDGRATGVFVDPNELGVFSALALVASVTVALTAVRRLVRFAGVGTALLSAAALALSFSRLSWVAVAAAVLVLTLHRPARRLLWARFLPAGLVGLLGLTAVGVSVPLGLLGARLETLRDPAGSNPDDLRLLAWREAFRLFWERPVLGWGAGAYERLSAIPPSLIWARPLNHPHNGLLTVLVEQGLAGLVVTLAVVVVVLHGLARALFGGRRVLGRERTLTVGVVALGVVLAVHLTADYALRNPFIAVVTGFVLGLALALGRTPGTPSADTVPTSPADEVVFDGVPAT